VSADYDKVAALFEDIKSYLQRLKVLEHRVPAVPELELVITEVLTSIMVLCGISTKYIRTKRVGKLHRRLEKLPTLAPAVFSVKGHSFSPTVHFS
jgi:hypothetical protein